MTSSFACANLFLAAKSLDRVIGLKCPIWYRNHIELGTSPFPLHKVCVAAILLVHVLALQLPLSYDKETPDNGLCNTGSPLTLLIASLLGQVLPFLIISSSNIIFSFALLSRRRSKSAAAKTEPAVSVHEMTQRRHSSNAATLAKLEQETEKMKNERRYIRMLVFVTSIFLFLNLSSAVMFFFCSPLTVTFHNISPKNQQIIYNVAGVPLAFNHAGSILFYVFSGPMFRTAMKQAFYASFGKRISQQ